MSHRQNSTLGFRKSLVSACAALALGLTIGTPRDVRAEDTITFGTALSLTGKMATEAAEVVKGYDFYVRHINELGGIKLGDHKVKVAIKYYDDESSPATSAKLYERMINEDGIRLLLGPYSSGVTMAVTAVTEKYKLPIVLAHAAAQAIYDRGFRYVFGVLTPVDEYTSNFIKMAAEQKAQRVAIINESDLLPRQAAEGAARQANAAKLEVVYTGAYPTGTKDFSSMIEAMRGHTPDLLIFAGYTGDTMVIRRQMAEQGLKIKMMGVILGPTLPGFIETLGPLAEGILEPVQWTPQDPTKDQIFGWTATQFADIYQKEVGRVPDYHPPQSAAALEVFQVAIEKTGSLDPEKLRDAIAATDFESFYGKIKFNEKGENIGKGMSVVQVQQGKAVDVYPAGPGTARFVYPMVTP
jgi:branched-chain amino acid transport system substrate-binding protein